MINSRLEGATQKFLDSQNLLEQRNSACKTVFPLVTVGVCAKNAEKTIVECLNSIIDSNYDKSKLWIVVVDGKSADATLAVSKEVLEKSGCAFKTLSDSGKGLGFARQLVVENSLGEYVCWVDADSVLLPDFISNGVCFLANKSNLGVMIPLTLFFGNSIAARLQGYTWLVSTLNALVKKKTPTLALNGAITPIKVLKEVKGFDISIKGAGEDIDLFSRIKDKGYGLSINPGSIIYHRMRESWHSLFLEVRWWGGTQPKKKLNTLLKEVLLNTVSSSKQAFSVVKHFRDLVGVLMPLYAIFWNSCYFLSSI